MLSVADLFKRMKTNVLFLLRQAYVEFFSSAVETEYKSKGIIVQVCSINVIGSDPHVFIHFCPNL